MDSNAPVEHNTKNNYGFKTSKIMDLKALPELLNLHRKQI